MLQYDNSAFYYFALTLLTIYLIPSIFYTLSEFWYAFIGSSDAGIKPRTEAEKVKALKIKNSTTGFARLSKRSFLINFVFLLFALLLLWYLVSLVISDGVVQSFDPYSILNIEQGTSTSEIKKAYRRLSLKYHPDKNIGDKAAEEIFMKIAKAYEALTDEVSKTNYEKYGNPDGKQSLEVSIGLPLFLINNPKVVLVLYLIGMVIVIPIGVGLWYSNSKKFGEKNIMYDTYTAFYQLLKDGYKIKQFPEVMASASEFKNVSKVNSQSVKDSNRKCLNELYGKLKEDKKSFAKPLFEKNEQMIKGNLLLHAHVLRLSESLTPSLRSDLDSMLVKTPELNDGLIEIAQIRRWLATTLEAIRFSQCIIQGLWISNSPYHQLPHFINLEKDKIPSISFNQFLKQSDNDKDLAQFNSIQKEDIIKTCNLFPHLDIKTKIFVEEEEKGLGLDQVGDDSVVEVDETFNGDQIYESDLVTVRVTITRANVPDDEISVAPAVHAPFFPKTVKENWWLILTDVPPLHQDPRRPPIEAQIHAIEKISKQSREFIHELRFMSPPKAGSYSMELNILSDCYIGLDEKIMLNFIVKPKSELPVYVPHKDDLKLDNEPTLFEQVMSSNLDEESDSDSDSDSDEEDVKKKVKSSNDKDDASDEDSE